MGKTSEREMLEKLKESEEQYRIFASYQQVVSELRMFYLKDAPIGQIIQKTLDLIIEKFGYYMAWYAELIEKEKTILPKLWAGRYEKYLDGMQLEYESDKKDAKCAISVAILTKKAFGYADLEHDKNFEKWRSFALQYGYRSNQAIPLMTGGKCKSAFLIYSTRPFAFSKKLVEYLKGIVDELATIIENITERKRAEETLRKAHDELEQRVKERTAELVLINENLKQEIVDRQHAEELLRESKGRFRNLTEITSDWIWEVDKNGFYTYVSPKIQDILGYEPEEIIGKTPFDLMPPAEANRVSKFFNSIVASQKTFDCLENLNLHKNGHPVVLETSGIPIFDADGEFIGYRGIDRDITKRKRAEESLRKQTHDLDERVKELNCLYGISKIIERPDIAFEEMLQEIVDLIPPSWQYPEITCARIIIEGQEYKTKNFKETVWKQTSNIVVHGKRIGILEICYLEEKPESDEGPFLKEERSLISAIAEQLGRVTEHKQAEGALRKAHDKLERRVKERTRDLEIKTKSLEEINTALEVLLRKREEDKIGIEDNVLTNVKELVEPYIRKIKKTKLDDQQGALLSIIESNLNEIVSPFTRKMSLKYLNLTPTEIRIANLIRHDSTTKKIAEIMNVSPRTIETHRKNIRRKIGLERKRANLRSHLLSLH